MKSSYDVIVVGTGPAGCSAATVLAEAGASVLLLEKEKCSSYSIGASLLPYCYFPLQRLGMVDEVDEVAFIHKHNVQFIGSSGRVSTPFNLAQHLDHCSPQTWQVERTDFDALLKKKALEKGAALLEETEVDDYLWGENGEVVGVRTRSQGETREFQASLTLDANGGRARSATEKGWCALDPNLHNIAIWSSFENAKGKESRDEGTASIVYSDNENWFWYIPLRDGRVSVGIVGSKEYLFGNGVELETIFKREVAKNAWIQEHLEPANRVTPFQAIGDYPYESNHCAEDGLLLAGDAFSFLDPIFSSGLFLAMHSGIMAADAILTALKAQDYHGDTFGEYGRAFCKDLQIMRRLVHAFYDRNFCFAKFYEQYPEARSAVTDILTGNLHKNFDGLFANIEQFHGVVAEEGITEYRN